MSTGDSEVDSKGKLVNGKKTYRAILVLRMNFQFGGLNSLSCSHLGQLFVKFLLSTYLLPLAV